MRDIRESALPDHSPENPSTEPPEPSGNSHPLSDHEIAVEIVKHQVEATNKMLKANPNFQVPY